MAKIGPVDAPLIPTIILVTGGYIAWFAVHYWRDTTQVYPSGPVKSILTGKGLPKPVREGSAQDPQASAHGFTDLSTTIGNATTGIAAGTGVGDLGSSTTPGSVATLSHYSDAQVAELWTTNGGDPDKTQWVQGIVTAESGGDPNSTSSNPDGGTNVGLFQLDTKGVGSGYTIEELKDPVRNTQITIMATRNGTDWADWGDTFTATHGYQGKDNGTF